MAFYPKEWLRKNGIKRLVKTDIISLWGKILVACIPAAIVGLLLDNILENICITM